MSKPTKSQLKFYKLYITFGIVILLLPVIAYGANVAREKYIQSRNSNNINSSKSSNSSTIANSNLPKPLKVDNLFGLELEVPSENWKATVESKTGSKEQINRQMTLRIGDTSNSINLTMLELRRETRDKGYLNPNGEVPANSFGAMTGFKKAFENKIEPKVVIDRPNEASGVMTDNEGNKLESFKIGRLESGQQRGQQILFNLNTKMQSAKDLNKPSDISYPMYDTNFQLFPQYGSKYPDRFLYLRIDYGTPFKFSYGDYDKVVQSLKLVEF
jgi:hypothetical protein